VKTDELIVELTRSLEPVERLRSPAVRLARWTMVSLGIAALGVLAIGPRADIATAIRQPAFAALGLMALVTGIAAAASALVLSIPGAERTPAQRGIPLSVVAVWVLTLVAMLNAGGAAWARLLALPLHAACIVEITGFAVVPAWGLFSMIRNGAPLSLGWSAGLAALAAASIGVTATQVVCPIDNPAHHLVGHLAPMALLTLGIAAARRRSLGWLGTHRC
jgi:hypothetical protein